MQKRPALLKAECLTKTRVRVELVVSIMPLFLKIQLESVANQGRRDVSTAARDIGRQIMSGPAGRLDPMWRSRLAAFPDTHLCSRPVVIA
jgi:hypothetical protein